MRNGILRQIAPEHNEQATILGEYRLVRLTHRLSARNWQQSSYGQRDANPDLR
ncbi:conserved hypothetical protein [Xenorhabdus nematophila F1]|nr:conserved hypothetical protein [Xenorhabdus nematophila F1]